MNLGDEPEMSTQAHAIEAIEMIDPVESAHLPQISIDTFQAKTMVPLRLRRTPCKIQLSYPTRLGFLTLESGGV
jgi:hypothetical protein